MSHHTTPALEDLASEDGICPCRFGFAGEFGLCDECYSDHMAYMEMSHVDPQETFDYWEVQEWAF